MIKRDVVNLEGPEKWINIVDMKYLIRTAFAAALVFGVGLHSATAQRSAKIKYYQDEEEEDEWEEGDRSGFNFGLNIGAYFANKQSAMFYNGEALWNLGDVQANTMTIEERLTLNQVTQQQVTNLIGAESFTIPADAYPQNMRYNPGVAVGFRLGYRWNNDNGIFLDMNYVTVKAADKWTLQTNLLPDPMQGTADIRLYNIIGEEDRLNMHLGYRGAIMINDDSNWFIEGGGSFLATRLVDNYIEIEGTTFDLWLAQQGQNFLLGPTSNLTGTGLGWFAGTGVEVFFNDTYEINLGFRFSRDRVVMGDFEPWNPKTGEPRKRLTNSLLYLSFTL